MDDLILSNIARYLPPDSIPALEQALYYQPGYIQGNNLLWLTKVRDLGIIVANKSQVENWKEVYELVSNKGIDVLILSNKVSLVRLALENRVDPSTNDNYAIRRASANGHVEVVRLLLSDDRVDPSATDNYAIRRASANGHVEVVRLLLSDGRVDPSARNNYAIQFSSSNGHVEVVRLLLSDDRVDPSAGNNYAIQFASANGHVEVVRLLLSDGRVDPSARNNYAIQ
jgi:ankyrin repeat protein